MPQRRTRYQYLGGKTDLQKYPAALDPADTIYAANYLLGYFRTADDAPELMRLQKEQDLKEKGLWDTDYQSPFLSAAQIEGPDFGLTIYAAGQIGDNRRKRPQYLNLLDLTSTHINAGGWQCSDFIVTLSNQHQGVKVVDGQPTPDEFVLGFIRLDSGTLNNGPLQQYLGMQRLTGDFANQHLLTGKVIVPTQPFGSLFRGGKLLALIAISNELRDWMNQRYDRNIALFYTTSLYGSSKSSSQYDQLERYLNHIGDTDASFPLRLKDPHKKDLITWMDKRGISRYQFTFTGSSKADRSHAELVRYVSWCLQKNSSDAVCRQLRKQFNDEMDKWKNGKTEKKKVYVSIYGMPEWDEVLVGQDVQSNPEFDLENLVSYWKRKVFKEKSWGLRKVLRSNEFPVKLGYELLNQQLKIDGFNQVR